MLTSTAGQLERARLISGGVPLDLLEEGASDGNSAGRSMLSAKWRALLREINSAAGVDTEQFRKLAVALCAVTLPCAAGSILLWSWIPLLVAAATLLAASMWYRRKIFTRAELFERDYPTLLVSLASAVRTGIDPIVALAQSEILFPSNSEVAKAMRRFNEDLEHGHSEETALARFAADIKHPDLQLFRSAYILARKHGSSVGECLYRLTKVTRQRQSFRRKMRAAVAMQKLSAFGIFGCALTIALIQYLSNPKAVNAAMQHPLGFRLLTFGAALIVAGLAWMLFMVRKRL